MKNPNSGYGLHRAELEALRHLANSVRAQTTSFDNAMKGVTRAMERLGDRVEDVDKRLIRVEEAKHGREIERLETKLAAAECRVDAIAGRVDILEGYRDRQIGAGAFVGWLHRFGPWIVAVIAGVAAWMGQVPFP